MAVRDASARQPASVPRTGMADEYLRRIGLDTASHHAALDLAALDRLVRSHQRTVPFENLGVHTREPLSLAPDALLDKIVRRARGGMCFELNGVFAALLREHGVQVRLLPARIATNGGWGLPYGHLVLLVEVGGLWLVDVGNADQSPPPLPIDQAEPHKGIACDGWWVCPIPGGAAYELRFGNMSVYRFRLEDATDDLAEFTAAFWWHRTSPESRFTRSLICTLPTPSGRVTLSGRRLVRTVAGVRNETHMYTEEEVLAAYRDLFGIELSHEPRVMRT